MQTTNQYPVSKINSGVPAHIIGALTRRNLKTHQFTDMLGVFHCIQIGTNHWVGVAGDGDNGSYEYFSMRENEFECTDVGYGSTECALRDALVKHVT